MKGLVGLAPLLVALSIPCAGSDALPRSLPADGFEARKDGGTFELPADKAKEWRTRSLSRARVWEEPELAPSAADLRTNTPGPGAFAATDELPCRFKPDKSSGATPKFECVFEGGEVLKVKYGANPEVQTEVAASRLLLALGFGSDRVYAVRKVRCFGCPEDPHALLRCLSSPFEQVRRECLPRWGKRGPTGEYVLSLDYKEYVDFAGVAIERRMEGKPIQAGELEGWGFDELEKVADASLGATRAERHALELMAVLLNNWDTRPDNQALVCLPGGDDGSGWCTRPFAYMRDVGATFGRVGGEKQERKLDVEGWSEVPIWSDARACTVRIPAPRFHGATFPETTISESGRQLLAGLLSQLSEQQLRDLFEGARFGEFADASPADRDVDNWVRTFQGKVRQIVERGPCPTP
jgi:hypothetical protein